jgi:hypothetical protein
MQVLDQKIPPARSVAEEGPDVFTRLRIDATSFRGAADACSAWLLAFAHEDAGSCVDAIIWVSAHAC